MILDHLFDPMIAFDIIYEHDGRRWNVDVNEFYQKPLFTYIQSIPEVLYRWAAEDISNVPPNYRPESFDLPEISFGILNTQRLNCYATHRSGRYYIGMSGMIPMAALEIACYFFSDNDFFVNIGEPDKQPFVQLDGVEAPPFFQFSENRYWPLIWDGLPRDEAQNLFKSICTIRGNTRRFNHETGQMVSAEEYWSQNFSVMDLIKPQCPVRRAHCDYISIIMSTFFWLHEITHVTAGHLRLLAERNQGSSVSIAEFPDWIYGQALQSEDASDSKLLLAMEFDADIEAVMLTIGLIMQDLDQEHPLVTEKYLRVELFIFFLFAIFGSISLQDKRLGRHKIGTHPPAKFRLINLMKYIQRFSSVDDNLNAAMLRGMERTAEFGRFGKLSYLRNVFSFEVQELEAWNLVDMRRAAEDMESAASFYGNFRLIVHSFLVGLLDGGVIEKPKSRAS